MSTTKTGKKKLSTLSSEDPKKIFMKALSNELGRAVFVCGFRPLKADPWRIHCVAGGDKLPFEGDPSSPAANLLDTKLPLNSTISDAKRGARFLSADLKDHFLASDMAKPHYMRIPYKKF